MKSDSPPHRATPAEVIALARAGATQLAASRLVALSPADRLQPAIISLEGRLLKDQALAAAGGDRLQLFNAASQRYLSAAEGTDATYPLINAATLSLLGGDERQAHLLAEEVLRRLEANPEEPETPYWRTATRAEALLLIDRQTESRAALAEAVADAPRAWEDHASTLRQFALILQTRQANASWLEAYRPPKSLHFGGHMSFRGDESRVSLSSDIVAILDYDNIGFGYGALAAGADIIVAEALLEHGAELHAVLPGGVESFAALSVDPYGAEWRRRFDAVVERASSVRIVRPLTTPDEAMIALADEVAMGAALMNARRLETSAVQLLVLAEGASERARDVWAEAGRPQHILCSPREEVSAEAPPAAMHDWRRLALVAAAPESPAEGLGAVRDALASRPEPALGPYLEGNAVTLAYSTPLEAAETAIALRDAVPGLRIGGHYGVAERFLDPFSGGERVTGDAAAAAAGALSSALPGTAYITEDFAAALIAAAAETPRTEYIGELDPPDDGPPVGLFVLKS